MSKTLKKFCKLSKYIEQIDKDLFQVLDDLCIMHYFKPNRDAGGITFLYPKEKAYRQKIINAAYSTDPNVAVNMIKALILQGFFNSEKDFNGNVVNLLNQKLEIESAGEKSIKLANGLTLAKDEKFVPMGYRENMAVYTLSGKGEIPLNGPTGEPNKKASSVTGGFGSYSKKSALHQALEQRYLSEIGKADNIYVKKVRLQIKLLVNKLQQAGKSPQVLMDYLGNDEFSDSYLLDMYCEQNCTDCFSTLSKCINNEGPCDARIESIDVTQYRDAKKAIVGEGANENVSRPESNVHGLRSPMDIRERVLSLYGSNKDKLGKDLFIVFCNVAKDEWLTDSDKAGAFQNFAFVASKVYTKFSDLVNQEFDVARDLTLYGNLLKSDVLLYVPQADFNATKLSIPSAMPSPLDMSLFSLCGLMHRASKIGGSSDRDVSDLLQDL